MLENVINAILIKEVKKKNLTRQLYDFDEEFLYENEV